MIRKYILIITVTLLLFLSGCSLALNENTPPPADFSATQGTEMDSVVLNWNAVEGAGVYYIYREESPEYGDNGPRFLGSTILLSYIDTEIEPEQHYWYWIKAFDFWGNDSTDYAGPAEGWTHVYAWRDPVTISEDAEQLQSAVRGNGNYFAVHAPRGDNVALSAQEYQEDSGSWDTLPSPGTTITNDEGFPSSQDTPQAFDLVITGGTPYLAYIDADNGYSLTVKEYGDSEWRSTGNEGFSVEVSGYVQIASDGTDLFVAARDTAGNIVMYQYDTGASIVWGALPVLPAGNGDHRFLSLDTRNGTPYIASDYDTGSGRDIVIYNYDSSWLDITSGISVGESSYISFSIQGRSFTLVTVNTIASQDTLTVRQFSDSSWEELNAPGFTTSAGDFNAAVSLNAGTMYLFYQDISGTVLRHENEEWSNVGDGGITQGIPLSYFSINTAGDVIRTSYVGGGRAVYRVWD